MYYFEDLYHPCSITQQELSPLRGSLEDLEAKLREQVTVDNNMQLQELTVIVPRRWTWSVQAKLL